MYFIKQLMRLGRQSLVPFLGDRQLDAFTPRQWNVRFAALTNDEYVVQPSGKCVPLWILYMDNIKRSRMTFSVYYSTNTPQVTTSCDHAQVARVKTDWVHNFWRSNFKLYCIIYFDDWIRISDSSAIVCHQERNTFWSGLYSLNFT